MLPIRTGGGSSDRFGYSWDRFFDLSPDQEEQFRLWTTHVDPERGWKGVRFLDAGCGMGRNSVWAIKHLHHIVFDQMLPKTAFYWRRNEALALLEGAGLKDIQIYWVNQCSWTVIGTKPLEVREPVAEPRPPLAETVD